MYPCMTPGAIGISLDWKNCLPLAQEAGFKGIDVPIDPQVPANWYRDLLDQYSLLPGGAGLPFHPSDPDAKVEAALQVLPSICQTAQAIGQTRFSTWILPFSDQLPWKENFRLHADRLSRAARIMDEYGCRLGLEFVGPKTLRDGRRYNFIYTLEGMLELCEAVGPNAGLLLDSYHWYTALGTVESIRCLDNHQVVYVHVNDAPAGVPVEQQQDLVRALPGDTGVIDIAGFMGALKAIAYDGPVTPEPFVKSLAEMRPSEAARRVGQSMERIWP